MISFAEKNKSFRPISEDMQKLYKERSASVVNAAASGISDKILLGNALIDLWQSNSYCTRAEDYRDILPTALLTNCHQKIFFSVCEDEFGLDKSQVSRLMNVVDEFCIDKKLKDEWKDYRWSHLVEMLPLSPEERSKVLPSWTVRQIRDLKKSFVPDATSQQNEDDSDNKKDEWKEPSEFKDMDRKELIQMIWQLRSDRYRLYRVILDNGLTVNTMESGTVKDFDFNAEYPVIDIDEFFGEGEDDGEG